MPNNCTALEKEYGGYANNNILDMVERIMLLSGFSRELIVKCDQRSARSSSPARVSLSLKVLFMRPFLEMRRIKWWS